MVATAMLLLPVTMAVLLEPLSKVMAFAVLLLPVTMAVLLFEPP